MKTSKKLILLVDDSRVNLLLGKNVLEKKYNVFTMSSAKKLFAFLLRNKADLILLDIDMPEMNGFEAIKILKEKPETRDVPVIFLSASTKTTDKATGLSLGAIDFVAKPYEPSRLIECIEAHLNPRPA